MVRFVRGLRVGSCVIVAAFLGATGCAETTLDAEGIAASKAWIVGNRNRAPESSYPLTPSTPPPRPRRPRTVTISLAGLELESDTPEGRWRTRMRLDCLEETQLYRDAGYVVRDGWRDDPRMTGDYSSW